MSFTAACLMLAAASVNLTFAQAATPQSAGERRLEPSDFRLVGGWRLAQEYPRGGLAIDFDNGRVFMGGHAQRQEIVEFSLLGRSDETRRTEPIAPGTGNDVMKWPRLDPVEVHAGFWQGGYAGGLYYKDNTNAVGEALDARFDLAVGHLSCSGDSLLSLFFHLADPATQTQAILVASAGPGKVVIGQWLDGSLY